MACSRLRTISSSGVEAPGEREYLKAWAAALLFFSVPVGAMLVQY
jgi:hypothetical protein